MLVHQTERSPDLKTTVQQRQKMTHAKFFTAAFTAVIVLGMTACSPNTQSTAQSEVCSSAASTATGTAQIGGPFTLINQEGVTVTDATFKGRHALMYFGFSLCPDVCPTSLMRMGNALRETPETAKKLTPIFVSLDVERDSPESLKDYVGAGPFAEGLVGLTGTPEQRDAIVKAFKVYWDKVDDPSSAAEYTIGHSDLIYLMDPNGELVDIFTTDDSPAQIASCLDHYIP